MDRHPFSQAESLPQTLSRLPPLNTSHCSLVERVMLRYRASGTPARSRHRSPDLGERIAPPVQDGKQLFHMLTVTGLQLESHFHLLHGQRLHRGQIIQLPYVDLQLCNACQELIQLAWTIFNRRTHDGDASLAQQSPVDEATKQVYVDVPTREEDHDLFACQVEQPGAQQRCQAYRSRALNLQFTAFLQQQNGMHRLFVFHSDNPINEVPDDGECQLSGAFQGDSIGNRADGWQGSHLSSIQRSSATGRTLRLDPYNSQAGFACACGDGDA